MPVPAASWSQAIDRDILFANLMLVEDVEAANNKEHAVLERE